MCEDPRGKLQRGLREGAETTCLLASSFLGSLGRSLSFAAVGHQPSIPWATASQKDARLYLFNQQTLVEPLLCARPVEDSFSEKETF